VILVSSTSFAGGRLIVYISISDIKLQMFDTFVTQTYAAVNVRCWQYSSDKTGVVK
jgi:hypothetical protein